MQRQEQEHQEQKDQYYYSNFINSLKSKNTKRDYRKRLGYFMTFLGIKEGEYSRVLGRQKTERGQIGQIGHPFNLFLEKCFCRLYNCRYIQQKIIKK